MLRIGGQRIPSTTLLAVFSDIVLVAACLLSSIFLRFGHGEYAWEKINDTENLGRIALVVVVCVLSLYYAGVYEILGAKRLSIFSALMQALGIACLVLGVLYYLVPQLALGRGITALAAPAILILTMGWRILFGAARVFLPNPGRVRVVGTGSAGISLVREICARPELNLKVVGFLDEKGENIGKPLVNPGIIGGMAELQEVVAREKIDQVVLSLAERRGCTPVRDLLDLKFAGVQIEDAHSSHERLVGRIALDELSPSWLILSDGFRKSKLLLVAKRAADIFVSSLVLLLAWPLMALIAAAIWVESGSPVLFRQSRVGLGGREFEILKFRSMIQDAESGGPRWATEDDKRITRLGRVLRTYRLDELPQFINVLLGHMSLVGPRPERPFFCSMLEEKIHFFRLRHTVRPGITGWAQIKYRYGASVNDSKRKLELDLFYIKHLSASLDLAIMFETAKVILLGRGAN